jgi:hypothetical protein
MGTDDSPRLIRIDTAEREVFLIPEGTTRIGRSRGLDLCLEDTAVSRFHCFLVREGDVVRVFEGESKNPARIDDEPVHGQPLKSGHTLRIGRCEFAYEGPLPAARDAGPATVERSPAIEARAASRRVRARSRESGLPVGFAAFLGVGFAATFGVLLWLAFHVGSGGEPKRAEPSAAVRLEESQATLERLVAELEKKHAANEDTSRFAALLEEQRKRIAELRAELSEERDRDRSAKRAAVAKAPSSGEILYPELDSAPEMKDAGVSSTTIVVPSKPSPVKRSKKDVDAMVARLLAKIDDYATHTVFPATLEPDLTDLSSTAGKDGADGVLAVYSHARTLLHQADASIETNQRRREQLLRKAEQTTPVGAQPAGAASRQEGMYKTPVSVQAEADQRLLEAFTKAAEIHRRHRDHLLPLRDAVLASVQRLTDADALTTLRSRFADESDVDLCRAILPAFQAAAYRDGVPVLYSRLGVTKDAALKAALVQTLASVTGVDLGDKASAWAEWWNQNGR